MRILLAYMDVHKADLFGYDFSSEVYIHNTTDLTLGLASIKAYSKLDPHIKKNCQFINRVYIDSFSIKTITEDILSQNPDLVCFSVNVWNFEETKCIWESIKYINSNIKVILGGPMVPIDVQSSRKMLEDHKEIDALVRGEGEIAFRQLLRFYLKKEALASIPNVILRDGNNIFTSTNTVSIADLSEIPSPYLTGDLNIYDNAIGLLVFETSRGCVNNCAYCHYHGGEHPKFFTLDKVKKELELFKSKGFNGQIYVVDPLLNFDKEWFMSIVKIMSSFKFKISLELRLELLDDEMIEALTKFNDLDCSVGLQSITPKALKDVNRPCDIEKCRKVLLKLVKKGINTGVGLILGLPGDNYETFKNTIDWVVLCNVRHVNISDLILIPNSDLEKEAKRFKFRCNNQNVVLSNYTFSESELIKASHFRSAFHFLHECNKDIFNISICKHRLKPSKVVEKFVESAIENQEMPYGRLLDFGSKVYSDKTIFRFLSNIFDNKDIIKHFLKSIKINSRFFEIK